MTKEEIEKYRKMAAEMPPEELARSTEAFLGSLKMNEWQASILLTAFHLAGLDIAEVKSMACHLISLRGGDAAIVDGLYEATGKGHVTVDKGS